MNLEDKTLLGSPTVHRHHPLSCTLRGVGYKPEARAGRNLIRLRRKTYNLRHCCPAGATYPELSLGKASALNERYRKI